MSTKAISFFFFFTPEYTPFATKPAGGNQGSFEVGIKLSLASGHLVDEAAELEYSETCKEYKSDLDDAENL